MDITWIVESIIAVAFIFFMSKIGPDKMLNAYNKVKILVQATEQLFPGKDLGEVKKEFVEAQCTKLNLNLDEEKVDMLIESAVKEMNMQASKK